MAQDMWYPPGSASATSVSANQGTPNTNANAWPVKVIDNANAQINVANQTKQDTGNTSLSSIDTKLSSQATAAKQDTGNTSLGSIDTKLSSQATAAKQDTGNTSLSSIDTKLSSQATAAKQATKDINVIYDYRSLTYVGATTKVATITYKTGGSAGTSVATQTFAYDGSDRVTSITTTYP